jgi:hypothetical protein
MFNPNNYDDELVEIKTGEIDYTDDGAYFPDFEVYYNGVLVDIGEHYHFVVGKQEELLEKIKRDSEEAEIEARWGER